MHLPKDKLCLVILYTTLISESCVFLLVTLPLLVPIGSMSLSLWAQPSEEKHIFWFNTSLIFGVMGLSLVLYSRSLILKYSHLIGAWFVICASSPNIVVGTSLPTFRGTPQSLYTSWYFPGQVTSKTLCSFIVEALYIWGKKPVLLQLSLRCVGILLLSCSSFAFFVMLHFDRKWMLIFHFCFS